MAPFELEEPGSLTEALGLLVGMGPQRLGDQGREVADHRRALQLRQPHHRTDLQRTIWSYTDVGEARRHLAQTDQTPRPVQARLYHQGVASRRCSKLANIRRF